MVKEIIVKKTFDIIYNYAADLLKGTKIKIVSDKKDIEDSLNHHSRFVKNWSSEISFSDLKKSKDINDVFVELDL